MKREKRELTPGSCAKKRQEPRMLGLGLVLLFAASPLLAQAQDKESGASNAPKSDTPAATAAATTAEKKKPKKVWTNEEIGSVGGTISVVGEQGAPSNAGSTKKPAAANGADQARQQQIDNYRNEIEQIHAQMDSIDKRIAQLKSFKGENTSPSGGININQGYNMVPVEDQVKQLEEKKKKLEAKIEDIEVEARKNGIDSGDLR